MVFKEWHVHSIRYFYQKTGIGIDDNVISILLQ
jgi:hypothetical protein